MKNAPILSLRNASISFAKKILFEDFNLNIFYGDKICLIGKNGVGKTTLVKSIAGIHEIDDKCRFIMPSIKIGYLTQSEKIDNNYKVIDYLNENLQLGEEKQYLIDIVCDNLKIDKYSFTQNLSGGQKRRVNLAKALIDDPDILLLDEPTNHLDIETISWLESYLKNFKGALLVISHDRKFLENVTNKVVWLRLGNYKINNHGYKNFDEWSQNIIDQENRELTNLEKKYELESSWLQTGVTARRKRNIGRLASLNELRAKLQKQRSVIFGNKNNIKINITKFDEDSPDLILSMNNISKLFEDKILIDKFNIKIIKKERIGIVGKNGSGKSTFLKLLVGDILPDSGNIKLARDITISYFDQERESLDPNKTIQEVLCENGSDYVNLANGVKRHICGYIKDFLFDPNDIHTKISTLSGGQKNRLLLAKTFANPGHIVILDEPTNDLDMESLDILEEYLNKYEGTLIIVSHDRNFLDNTVTTILSFEGKGAIENFYGNYSEFTEYKNKIVDIDAINKEKGKKIKEKSSNNSIYKYKVEFNKLTSLIEDIEEKIERLTKQTILKEKQIETFKEISNLQDKLDSSHKRWEELCEILEGEKT